MELKTETELKIMEAAKKVFLEKGFEGTRMQDIAGEASINKALLHYYYRSKDKLFQSVFQEAFKGFFPRLNEILMSASPLEQKIKSFIESYMDLLLKNPHLPHFVLHEVKRNPGQLLEVIRSAGINPEKLFFLIEQEIKKGNIRDIPPAHLLINIISMCVFPFIGRPVMEEILFANNKDAIEKFYSERKEIVYQFVWNSIKIK